MTTLSELRERVYRVLSDPGHGLYTPDMMNDGIVAAMEAILPWVSKRSVATLEADGVANSFELPEDIYRVTAVFDADSGSYLPENSLSSGSRPGMNLDSNQDYLQYPEGYLSLANAPTGDLTVYYGARWAVPVEDEDVIEAPIWVHRALVFYAASYALLDKASSASNIRQWNVQVDSGTPIMNPMRDMSTYYLERFSAEMARMPASVRGS